MAVVRVDDIDMHYVEAGSGPPLVLIHGLGGSHLDWEHQIGVLATRFRVIAPDLRGFGRSGTGRRLFSIRRLMQDVVLLLDRLGIAQCQLIGHSMGGAIVQQLSLDHPQRVQRLVVANSMPMFRPQTRRHVAEFAYRWLVMGLLGPARLSRIGAQRMYPREDQAAEREKSAARGAHTSRYAYLAALAGLGRWSVLERLGEMRLPVLILAAEHDYYTREETVRFAHALPRGRLHIVAGAHHALPSEMPEVFNRLVMRFLRTADAPRETHDAGMRARAAEALASSEPEPAPMPDVAGPS
ncbi:alpha/beta fold hydrolase [Solimonas terrae]|uniref:Alpha/beta fold hydrolase n=1 Tax=Solimonas terrae TaxID=1396819 RepID=A0A6M2BMW6_9GAMM|nr:alpha/beta hydrolase [Solimonas terrae]NGY03505.1 alpha/beta fold hydrolase [Solimonas terrae]